MELWEDGVGCSVKWLPVLSHCRSAWPGEWEDSTKQTLHPVTFIFYSTWRDFYRQNDSAAMMRTVQHWVRTLATDFFDEGGTETCALIWQMSQFWWRLCRIWIWSGVLSTHRLCFRKDCISNLGLGTDFPGLWVLYTFPQTLQANTRIMPWTRSRELP
jgi:hypothetical protein